MYQLLESQPAAAEHMLLNVTSCAWSAWVVCETYRQMLLNWL